MIVVEHTQKNWEIFSQLCELDAEYRVCNDESAKSDIISKALEICEDLELGDD